MEETRTAKLYRFGVFEADARTGELHKQGRRLHLTGQPFQVLLLLLGRPGRVISREEIHQQLWPNGTFVDFDHGLNAAINKLRESLGDSATSPRFIETLPRRGYRFIAPVEVVEGAVAVPETREAAEDCAEPQSHKPTTLNATPEPSASHIILGRPLLTHSGEVPQVSRRVVRTLFVLSQLMYLCFYIIALARLVGVENLLESALRHSHVGLVVVIFTAAVGIPIRLYLLSAIAFRAPRLAPRYAKLFPPTFLLDELWALAPFLLAAQIGFGLALASTAALLYLPFAQRSLILMGAGDFAETK